MTERTNEAADCSHPAWLHIGSERYCASCGADRDELASPNPEPPTSDGGREGVGS